MDLRSQTDNFGVNEVNDKGLKMKTRKDIKGLCLGISEKEYITIGNGIVNLHLKKNGSEWRIVIECDKDIPINRIKYKEEVENERSKQ
jgi:hypothetical protein